MPGAHVSHNTAPEMSWTSSKEFWGLQKADQDSLLTMTMSTGSEPTPSVASTTSAEISFLGQRISSRCLSALLGIGKARLRKGMNSRPDLRYGKSRKGRFRGASSVDAWLAIQYSQIAETLPDRFIRRGRAQKADDLDFDMASDVEDEELSTWLEKPSLSTALQLLNSSDGKKMTKFLPPGSLAELFEQYRSTRTLLQADSVSYSTFLRVYRERWADVLKFRERNLQLDCFRCSLSLPFCLMSLFASMACVEV